MPSSLPKSCMRPACPKGVFNLVNGDGPTVGQVPGHASRCRHDVVHRLDPRRHRSSPRPAPIRSSASSGTRRQIRQHPFSRCRSRTARHQGRRRLFWQQRPVLQRADAHVCAAANAMMRRLAIAKTAAEEFIVGAGGRPKSRAWAGGQPDPVRQDSGPDQERHRRRCDPCDRRTGSAGAGLTAATM